MIVSQLPPSRFLGSVAASIHTPVFKCFVSTARRFFISRQWETMIFEGDPGDQDGFSRFARFFYRPEFSPASIYVFHEVLISRLDKMGQSGTSLMDAYATVFTDLINREIAEASREPMRHH